MEIVKPTININFVGKMKIASACSLLLIIISIVSVVWHGGLNLGIDFSGGTLIQIKFQRETATEKLRNIFRSIGLENSIIQQSGTDEIIVRTASLSSDLKDFSRRIEDALGTAYGKGASEIRRVEVVGPKVGRDLRNKAIMALVFSWIGMLIYISWRFEFRYAVGGILALIHDVTITVGVFSLLNKEFTLVIVAALLTIIGYSINDTIVIFDRIRENARKNVKQNLKDTINTSINQTLSRTILTSFTVFMVVAILFIFGGAVIHDFAFALLVGLVTGTYSTVFIASPFVLAWENIKLSKIKRKK